MFRGRYRGIGLAAQFIDLFVVLVLVLFFFVSVLFVCLFVWFFVRLKVGS